MHRRLVLSICAVAGALTLVHAQLQDACQGRTQVANREVHTCNYSGCGGNQAKGYTYSQICTTWCCPNGQGQYDPATCVGTYNTGKCCTAGSGATTPNFLCNAN